MVIAMVSDLVATRGATPSLVAMGIAAVYVIASTIMPEDRYRERFGAETITLVGAVIVLAALAITGGADSPYLLVSMGPPIFATVYGGLRVGLTTGGFSAGLLALIVMAGGGDFISAAPAMSLYLVFVVLVGVIRKLLQDIHQRAAELAEEKETATRQLEQLEEIHAALLRLSEDVSSGRFNAVEVAAETLGTILDRHPGSAGKLAVNGENGPVVLAARGMPPEVAHVYELPLSTREVEVGSLELTVPRALSPAELAELAAVLHPVSVAFANLQLLQNIVGSAVAEERVRLAREIHDGIGPSLAALGLAVDMAAMRQSQHPGVVEDLKILRSNVTMLVEETRAAVADLRTAPGPTLTARLLRTATLLDGEPDVVVDVDERRPPRPSLIGDLAEILAEAVRNGHRHSGASKIVVSGQVDRDFGSCTVTDDGMGFDPDATPEGHYGILGMWERAAKIGATMKIDSKPGVGTVLTVEWGNP
jgi:signal transduction histidine kinase